MSSPAQVAGVVLTNADAGAYRRLVLQAPAVAERALPGQFVACAVGGPTSSTLLRRAFSLHSADAASGRIEVVVAPHAPGTEWVCTRREGDTIDVVGPLGRAFRAPAAGEAAVLVGGGYGAAPLQWWARTLRAQGNRADLVIGAADTGRLFGHLPADLAGRDDAAVGGTVAPGTTHVTTEDGSSGTRGRVTDVLGEVIAAVGARTVYACGPMAMLRAVHEVAAAHGAASQLAVEESMACGIGVCMTCVLPVAGADGVTRMTRSCIDGPVFDGGALRWDAIDIRPGRTTSRVPDDCLGAPTGGH